MASGPTSYCAGQRSAWCRAARPSFSKATTTTASTCSTAARWLPPSVFPSDSFSDFPSDSLDPSPFQYLLTASLPAPPRPDHHRECAAPLARDRLPRSFLQRVGAPHGRGSRRHSLHGHRRRRLCDALHLLFAGEDPLRFLWTPSDGFGFSRITSGSLRIPSDPFGSLRITSDHFGSLRITSYHHLGSPLGFLRIPSDAVPCCRDSPSQRQAMQWHEPHLAYQLVLAVFRQADMKQPTRRHATHRAPLNAPALPAPAKPAAARRFHAADPEAYGPDTGTPRHDHDEPTPGGPADPLGASWMVGMRRPSGRHTPPPSHRKDQTKPNLLSLFGSMWSSSKVIALPIASDCFRLLSIASHGVLLLPIASHGFSWLPIASDCLLLLNVLFIHSLSSPLLSFTGGDAPLEYARWRRRGCLRGRRRRRGGGRRPRESRGGCGARAHDDAHDGGRRGAAVCFRRRRRRDDAGPRTRQGETASDCSLIAGLAKVRLLLIAL